MHLPEKFQRGTDCPLTLRLINRGFATVFGEHSVYFVLIDDKGGIAEFPTEANPVDWQPFELGDTQCTSLIHSVDASLKIQSTLLPGKYKLGLWIPDGSDRLKYDARYAIRCANGDTEWQVLDHNKYGVTILTSVEIK